MTVQQYIQELVLPCLRCVDVLRYSAGMALKFKILGIEVVADDAAEAYALLSQVAKAELKAPRPAAVANGVPSAPWPLPTLLPAPAPQQLPLPSSSESAAQNHRAEMAERFLKAVKACGNRGLDTKGMLHVFNTQKPKALGSKTGVVNAVLEQLGFRPNDAYQGERAATGKVFKPGPRIDDAINACAAAAIGL
jgi:hypothetical protein